MMPEECQICGKKTKKLYSCRRCGRKVCKKCFHDSEKLCEICYNRGEQGKNELNIPESAKPMSVSPKDIKK